MSKTFKLKKKYNCGGGKNNSKTSGKFVDRSRTPKRKKK
jgi:hypothetical protein